MIVADTSALVALIDADDRHHAAVARLFEEDSDWVLPWAILPEVDYLLARHVGSRAQRTFLADLAENEFIVEWGQPEDLSRARHLCERYDSLGLGLVDSSVIAVGERLGVTAIATLDLRHFGAVEIAGRPRILPRDL